MEPAYSDWDKELDVEYKQLIDLEKNLTPNALKAMDEDLLNADDPNLHFLARIALKRITYYQLPLKFSFMSLCFLANMTLNPGRMIVALIDLLNAHGLKSGDEAKEINLVDVYNLYGGKTYSEEYFAWLVDEEIKSGKRQGWYTIY